MVTRDPLPPAVGAALDDILRETLGSGARPAAIHLLKQAPDYWVARATPGGGEPELVVKLAGPGATLAATFERTAAVHRRVAAATGVPLPLVLAADSSGRRGPWRYLVRTYVPGEEWAAVRLRLTAVERAGALAQIGRAVAALHTLAFPAFGELTGNGAVTPAGPWPAALAARAGRSIADPDRAAFFLDVLNARAADFAGVTDPCLCHEDLHQHNLIFAPAGDGVRLVAVLDFEKAWAGHAEVDLARLELWRGMTGPGFRPAYRAIRTIAPDYPARRPVYQLLWCLEYGADTSRHQADTRRVCRALGVPSPLG